ncbi:hypothetical protein, conserved [Trypanosoma brucei gambiense DAL972]|uniref:Uncharacterized protein n=1 Tax=Trypanosoma brucei gambiense (strain MHOM/CI/86/DAL972) TaxID=679716 RepID=D0A2K9_TRYB9|nr:hypothetical protein, conserved [Trypanosoma brucei gambiense DAL972]CBH15503.1 hypothetical protein, conserved [Trypanosoma brucei gambiense DAL972]|eukprot:XP_011777767.1 hypothetical protein, conserved [Trypanosoma brucei gambiense DAL972]
MYSDGTRKTMSELQRMAGATRMRIAEEGAQLETLSKATTRAQKLVDSMFNLFASGATHHEREELMRILTSEESDIDISGVPPFPAALALANGQLPHVRTIRAARNNRINDEVVIFLSQVIRFSAVPAQVELLDISDTKVTERGLLFVLEMILERDEPFTLIAKGLVSSEGFALAGDLTGVGERFRKVFETVVLQRKSVIIF